MFGGKICTAFKTMQYLFRIRTQGGGLVAIEHFSQLQRSSPSELLGRPSLRVTPGYDMFWDVLSTLNMHGVLPVTPSVIDTMEGEKKLPPMDAPPNDDRPEKPPPPRDDVSIFRLGKAAPWPRLSIPSASYGSCTLLSDSPSSRPSCPTLLRDPDPSSPDRWLAL